MAILAPISMPPSKDSSADDADIAICEYKVKNHPMPSCHATGQSPIAFDHHQAAGLRKNRAIVVSTLVFMAG